MNDSLEKLDWQKGGGLLPAIVQDAATGAVLMLAYMSPESLEMTIRRRSATFFSRSRQTLWTKGETSGNSLQLVDIKVDCDRDTLLLRVHPTGPVCHRGTENCFDLPAPFEPFVAQLEAIIDERAETLPESSYTAQLFRAGTERMAQKVGEEAVEVVLAAVAADDGQVIDETADLMFHLLVLLRSRGISFSDVCGRLQARHSVAGERRPGT